MSMAPLWITTVSDRLMGSGVGDEIGRTGVMGLRLGLEDETNSQQEIFAKLCLVGVKLTAPIRNSSICTAR